MAKRKTIIKPKVEQTPVVEETTPAGFSVKFTDLKSFEQLKDIDTTKVAIAIKKKNVEIAISADSDKQQIKFFITTIKGKDTLDNKIDSSLSFDDLIHAIDFLVSQNVEKKYSKLKKKLGKKEEE